MPTTPMPIPRLRLARAVLVLCLGTTLAAAAGATDTAYLALVINGVPVSDDAGTPQSLGARARPGHPDEILVIGHGSRGVVPIGTGGLPTGANEYEPLRIRKFVDRTTPLLAKALARNEPVDLAELRLFRTGADGTEEHVLTIRLEGARLVDQSIVMNRAADGSAAHVEAIAIAFQTITWIFEPLGIEFQDTIATGA